MKHTLSTAILAGSLTLGSGSVSAEEGNKHEGGLSDTNSISTVVIPRYNVVTVHAENSIVDSVKEKIADIFNTNLWADTPEEEKRKIKTIFLREVGHELSDEEIDKFVSLLQKKEIQDGLYGILKDNKTWAIGSLVLALLLGIGYGYAYRVQIMGQLRNKNRINAKSFATFGSISGMMTLLNGMVPGSIVYFESFVLALTSVVIDKHNAKHNTPTETLLFKDFINNIPLPVVRYNKQGLPLIWNKQMEEETGYTYQEVTEYFNKHGDIMHLLYRGENLKKVQQYLGQIEKSGKGYMNIAFTMTTASGEEKTFLWTTLPDGQGGTMRIAKHLTDTKEMHEELEKTRELLRKDALTGLYNRQAMDEDLEKLLSSQKRERDPMNMVMVMMDIDNFKTLNDSHGHETGDMVLKKFSEFVRENLREGDRCYRIGGDEFVFLLESDNFDGTINKLNILRHDFFSKNIDLKKRGVLNSIGTSWGAIGFNTGSCMDNSESPNIHAMIEDFKSRTDEYMYAVKYYRVIKDRLIADGRIQEGQSEKNGIGKPVFDSNGEIVGAEILNEYGNFRITQAELLLINEIKRNKEVTARK